MTVPWSDDDERLFEELEAAVRGADAVDPRFLAAGRAAYAWRTVDAELLVLAEEASLSESVTVRGIDPSEARVLVYRGERLSIEMEVAAGRAEGQVMPPQECRLTKASLDGDVSEFDVDESGFFHLPVRDHETFRLQLDANGVSHVTEWFTA